jgi:hypothetical protein
MEMDVGGGVEEEEGMEEDEEVLLAEVGGGQRRERGCCRAVSGGAGVGESEGEDIWEGRARWIGEVETLEGLVRPLLLDGSSGRGGWKRR